MKTIAILSLVSMMSLVSMADAAIYTLQPSPSPDGDLWDLSHYNYYAWKITANQFNPASDEIITGASLFFDNIENWDSESNTLYVSLLSGSDLSFADEVFTGNDNEAGGDSVLAQFDGVPLVTFNNLPASPQDLIYNFNPADIVMLNAYAADGVFGIGFDPDCRYWNDGISLTIQTIPEPTTVLLLGLGGLGFLSRRRSA
jgi:hypothetical protein